MKAIATPAKTKPAANSVHVGFEIVSTFPVALRARTSNERCGPPPARSYTCFRGRLGRPYLKDGWGTH